MAIQTVRGLVNKEDLGFCHAHEHIFLAKGPYTEANPALRIDDYEKSREELFSFKAVGGRSVVDAQPIGCGRMADALLSVSKDTGIHIVSSTGFHKLTNYTKGHWLFDLDIDALCELFCREIQEALYVNCDTAPPSQTIPAKAGVIKTAIDDDRMYDPDKRWFLAAAQASVRTGAPILCHTESTAQGLYLAEFYLREGVQPNNIILCHLERTLDDIPMHREIAKLGVYLEYDTIGRFKYHDDESEVRLIMQMLEWGFGSSLLLGLDTTRQRLKSYGGDIGLPYIKKAFIPMLKEFGILDKQIDVMMKINPAEAFSIKDLQT